MAVIPCIDAVLPEPVRNALALSLEVQHISFEKAATKLAL